MISIKRLICYVIIWTVIVVPLTILGAREAKSNCNYCDYEGCGLKLKNEYDEYCYEHEEKVWEERRSYRKEDYYYTPTPMPTPTPKPSPTPYRRRNNYSYGYYTDPYPNDPSDYSDYEDYYYDNYEDFDDLDEAEDYYNENGGEY